MLDPSHTNASKKNILCLWKWRKQQLLCSQKHEKADAVPASGGDETC